MKLFHAQSTGTTAYHFLDMTALIFYILEVLTGKIKCRAVCYLISDFLMP